MSLSPTPPSSGSSPSSQPGAAPPPPPAAQPLGYSFRVGSVAGIGVYVHITFALLLAFIAFGSYARGGGAAAINSILMTLAVFGCVFLHELGHAGAAALYKIRTHDITLLPIGGLARLERMPEKPSQEIVVALAGPAVNLAIALVLLAVFYFNGSLAQLRQAGTGDEAALTDFLRSKPGFQLLQINVVLLLFNLLPAFPMDGGRVLRAILATRLEYTRATRAAGLIGQVMALALGLAAIFYFHDLMLGLVAFFIWFAAGQEVAQTTVRRGLSGLEARDAMLTDFKSLEPHEPLSRAVDLIVAGSQHDFPVVQYGRVMGVVSRAALIRALAQQPHTDPVSSIMIDTVPFARPQDDLMHVLEVLQTSGAPLVPVMASEGAEPRLLGLVTAENIAEYMMIREAVETRRRTLKPA